MKLSYIYVTHFMAWLLNCIYYAEYYNYFSELFVFQKKGCGFQQKWFLPSSSFWLRLRVSP